MPAKKDKGKGKAVEAPHRAPPSDSPSTVQSRSSAARPSPTVIAYWADADGQGGQTRWGYNAEKFKAGLAELQNMRTEAEKAVDTKALEGAKVNKDDVAAILAELDVSTVDAQTALRDADGDLVKALIQLTSPPAELLPQPPTLVTNGSKEVDPSMS